MTGEGLTWDIYLDGIRIATYYSKDAGDVVTTFQTLIDWNSRTIILL